MATFRFEDLLIWQRAIKISQRILDISSLLRKEQEYTLSDQLYRATLSISNNIAEGSGSISNKEFAYFLNISRRSIFECANIINLLYLRKKISYSEKNKIYEDLNQLSKMIYAFRQRLLRDKSS